MNIHEYQAKELLKKFGAPVPNGVHGETSKDLLNKSNFCLPQCDCEQILFTVY